MTRVLVLGCFLAIGPTVLADQTPIKPPQAQTQFGALRQAQSDKPYRTLFAPRREAATTPKDPGKTVRCGMTIIEADPTFDPRIAVGPPHNGTKYTIRAVPPAVCGAPR